MLNLRLMFVIITLFTWLILTWLILTRLILTWFILTWFNLHGSIFTWFTVDAFQYNIKKRFLYFFITDFDNTYII